MAVTSRIKLELLAQLTGVAEFGATPLSDLPVRKEIVLTSGTGTGQVDKLWYDKDRAISASATDSLDIATGGNLTDAFGVAFAVAKLKAILVIASSANVGNINLTRPASNGVPLFAAAGDALPIVPGGLNLWVAPNAAGVAVTAATADLLDVVNAAASPATYDIVLLGASA